MPPVQPMLAKSVKGIPDPAKLRRAVSFEPKWDGFRCLVFRDGDEVELASRNTKPLTRYFPEVVAAVARAAARAVRARRRAVRGARRDGRAGWSSRRSRSGSTRPRRGSTCWPRRRPPAFVAFDLLALGDESYVDRPFAERRAALEEALGRARRALLPDPHHHRPGRGRAVVRPVRGRRARRRGRQAARARRTSRTPAPCSRSSTSAPPTWCWRATASTRPPRPSEPLLGSPAARAVRRRRAAAHRRLAPASPRRAGPS